MLLTLTVMTAVLLVVGTGAAVLIVHPEVVTVPVEVWRSK
jgi:hypothetical protein